MFTVAVTMVRDEADIIGSTVRHMLGEVDAVVAADNLSTDDTRRILDGLAAEFGDRLRVVDDWDPAYRQSEKMSGLAQLARSEFGADWVIPFDADEWWYSPFGSIGEALGEVPAHHHVVPATLFDHVATGLDPPAGECPDPVERIGWRRRDAAPMHKVAARLRPDLVIEQGNHGAHYLEFAPALFDPLLVVRHYPYRSAAQLVTKVRNGAAAYLAAGAAQPAHNGAHWRQWGDLLEAHGEEAIGDLFRKWYWRADPTEAVKIDGETQPPLFYDPAP